MSKAKRTRERQKAIAKKLRYQLLENSWERAKLRQRKKGGAIPPELASKLHGEMLLDCKMIAANIQAALGRRKD